MYPERVGVASEMNVKVPLSVSIVGFAIVPALTVNGCKKFFAGWMEKFGNPYDFLRSPNIRAKAKLQNPTIH